MTRAASDSVFDQFLGAQTKLEIDWSVLGAYRTWRLELTSPGPWVG